MKLFLFVLWIKVCGILDEKLANEVGILKKDDFDCEGRYR